MRSNCEAVVHSDFSKFFGINLEIIGMFYYGFVVVIYSLFLFFPHLAYADLVFAFAWVSTFAFAFSVYLVSLQAFVIKEWCAWCLGSAIISTVIAILSWTHADFSFFLMLFKWKTVLVIAHAAIAGIGVGTTTITDILFFKFLKDYRISTFEVDIMKTLSKVLWFSVSLLVITGALLAYLSYPQIFDNSKFVAKIFIVGLIIINGIVLNIFISPRLSRISFGEPHHHLTGELHRTRRLAFASGALSIVSWYTVFVLGSVRSLPYTTVQIMVFYFTLVVLAVISSQFFEKKFSNKEI